MMPNAEPSADSGTTVHRLENGLTVLIREDHFAPVVALQVWVGAGGADERDEEAGVAHVHEHMLFKGTKHRGVGEIANEIESSGGRINAWTSWNETVYHIVVASRHANTALDVLADAVRYSSFDEAELAKELGVVLEEWKRGQDSPSRRVFDALFDTAFQHHPYRRPVIGTKESIEGLTRDRILSFYSRFYAPNNMTVVIVGDVDTEAMTKQIEKRFGDFDKRELDRPERPVEPSQTTPRFASERMDVQEAQLALGFHVPGATHEDAPLLDLLAFVLGGGESSRLYRRLVAEQELATSIGAFAYTPPDPGLLVVSAALEADQVPKAYDAIIDELAKVRQAKVDVEELQRARTNLESDFVFRNETVQGQARELGYALTVYGTPDYDRVYLEKINAATIADLQLIAQKYLDRDNLTVVSLLPTDATERLTEASAVRAAAPLAERTEAPIETARASLASGVPTAIEPIPAGHDAPEPRLIAFDNGVRLIVQEHRGVPVFSMRAAMIGGLIVEDAKDNGISNFATEMLTRGTATRSREQLARDVESIAGSLEGSSGYNSIGLSASFLAAHLDAAFELFMDALLAPSFDAVEVEKTRRELLLAIKNRDDNPAKVAFDLAYRTTYPDHPFGMTTLGEAESVARLSADDLRAFYRRSLHPEHLVVAVVGDVDTDDIVARVRKALGGLTAEQPAFELPPAPDRPHSVRRSTHQIDRKQSHVLIAYQSVDLTDPDRYPLSVLDNILSGQGGRLFYELRDKQSLAYSVSAFFTKGLAPGLFGGYIGTDPSNSSRALDGLLAEFEKVRETRVQKSELERSQRYLIGSREIGLQSNGAKAEDMCLNELYGLGYRNGDEYASRISKVGLEDVQRVAEFYLDPETRSEILVGPAPALASAAQD